MADMSGGNAVIDVMPSMRGYFRRVQSEIRGNPVEHRIEPQVDERALASARSKVEKASEQVEKARRRQADATGAVAVAEARLNALIERGVTDAGRLAGAREQVARASRNAEAAATAFNRAMADERSSRARVARIEARFDGSRAEGEASSFFSRLVDRAGDHGRRVGSTLAGAVGGALSAGLKGVAGAAAGIAGTAATLGLNRLLSIDDARAKLRGLGHDAQNIETIMSSALASVKGTAFGLGDAATIAASAVAAGIKPGQELTKYLKLTADAAAIAGVGLDEMGSIFNKVQTNGKAFTDDLQQLADRGIPIFTWLQEELGVTGDALADMVKAGEIDAATFQRVIEKNIGGAALNMGDSVRGSFANLKAALGRLGAEVLEPFFNQATKVFGGLTEKLDGITAKVGPWADKVAAGFGLVFGILAEGDYKGDLGAQLGLTEDAPIVDTLFRIREAVQGFLDEYGPRLSSVFSTLRDAAREAAPAIAQIAGSIGEGFGAASITTWDLLVQALEALAPLIETVLVPALGSMADLMSENQGVVTGLIGTYAGFTAAATAVDTVKGAWDQAVGVVDGVNGIIEEGKGLYQTYTDATYGIATAQDTLRGKMAAAAGAIRGKAAAEGISNTAAMRAIVVDKLHAGALKIKAVALKAVTLAQKAWNLALSANPIGLVIVAIAALVAGLVWFFTQTETGRRLWETIWGAIQDAVSWAWERVIKPAWEGIQAGFRMIGEIAMWVWENVLSPVFTGIKYAVGIVLAAFVLLGMVFELIWNAMVAVARWAWETIMRPVFEAIGAAFRFVGDVFAWVWNNVIKPAWDALGAGIAWVWENIIRPAWGALQAALGAIGAFFVWVWDNVIKPAWDALGAGIRWVWENIILPAWNALRAALQAVGDFFRWVWETIIRPVWDALGAGIRWVVDNVILPVWDTLKGALDLVGRAFEKVVDWIGQVWDRIKAIAAKPVRFVVETVYNKGIVAAWNKVAGWLGIDPLQEADLGELGNYALGTTTIVPGYSPGHDDTRFVSTDGRAAINLSGGEGIARPEFVTAVGRRKWDELNAAARRGGRSAVRRELGGYAGGGVVESIVDKVQRFFPGMSITSTYRDTADLHGRGLAVDFSNGGYAGTPEMDAAARFFYENYGPMLAELIHWPLNGWQNIDEGRPFDFGAGTNDDHRDHVHVAAYAPLPEPGQPITPIPSGGGGGGFFGWLRRRVGDAFNAIMDPIGNAIPTFPGAIGELPRKAFDKFRSNVYDWLVGKADAAEGAGAGNGGPARDEVRRAFAPYGWDTGEQWAATDWIVTRESGWDPLARNPSSGAFGLFQFLGSTKDAYLPDENPDPFVQGRAGARYIADRYGTPVDARRWWENNGWYDEGGLATGRGYLLKGVVEPERVLSPRQTVAFERFVGSLERFERRPAMSQRDIDALEVYANGGSEFVAQKIENQWVVDPAANRREVRQASKRVFAERGL